MVRLTDRPDMTIDVYRGRKITTQQQLCFIRRLGNVVHILSVLMRALHFALVQRSKSSPFLNELSSLYTKRSNTIL